MTESKAWKWNEEKSDYWRIPSRESYYIAHRFKEKGYKKLLDFGCGLGRHSILFAKEGFDVSAFDLAYEGVENLNKWAKEENLSIKTKVADMLKTDYPDNSFDCIFAYHVISHTDSIGIKKIIAEMKRILKPGGEIFVSLCSKETRSFNMNFPKIDENTILRTEKGPEYGVPHFYVNLNDLLELFKDFEIENIEHLDECFYEGEVHNCKHYFVTATTK